MTVGLIVALTGAAGGAVALCVGAGVGVAVGVGVGIALGVGVVTAAAVAAEPPPTPPFPDWIVVALEAVGPSAVAHAPAESIRTLATAQPAVVRTRKRSS